VSEISIGKEVLEVAIEIEKNGRSFYESLARLTKVSKVRDIYVYLASQEKEHENTFREMLKRLGGYRPLQAYPGEHYQYIRDLADSAIFVGERVQAAVAQESRAVVARGIMSKSEALAIAIGFEKDSILLYSEIRGLVPKADQEIVDKVIYEERRHLRRLMDLKGRPRA
jgi:rubrerythrin